MPRAAGAHSTFSLAVPMRPEPKRVARLKRGAILMGVLWTLKSFGIDSRLIGSFDSEVNEWGLIGME